MIDFNPGTAHRELKGTRRASRDSLLLLATIRHKSHDSGDWLPVRVRNLSAVGMMADYDEVAGIGEPVEVNVRGIGTVAGTVAWLRRGRIGIAFDVEVDPMKVRRPGANTAPRP